MNIQPTLPINQVLLGDSIEVLKSLPDNSIDLIATDPPYFKVKKESWDRQWDKPAEFIKWLDSCAEQWQRILKPNGSLYCFASPQMSARVEVMLSDRFKVLNRITWKKPPYSTKAEMFDKESLRGFFPASESIVFCEHYGSDNIAKGEAGYGAKCDEAARCVFGDYIKSVRVDQCLTTIQLTAVVGSYGTVNHGGSCSNWENGKNCPTPEHYAKLQESFPGYFTKPYEELRTQYEELRTQYEELRRPFTVSADVPYTDVWTFPTVGYYSGKHPCEKPLSLMEHIISASSRPGAVVLDCFAGGGSTLLAAQNLDRDFIGVEKDPGYHAIAISRIARSLEVAA